MKLKLNISPCPNDTFMFDAMINGRIETDSLEFDVNFLDIEELNNEVMKNSVDVSKISYAILPAVTDKFQLSRSGGALGRGNGPLLVARDKIDLSNKKLRIAVPGEHTTANMLLRRFFPHLNNLTPVLFSEIAGMVKSGEFDAGILIHEGRFTYETQGLNLIVDLGAEWERKTGLPLPLGAIVVSRSLPADVKVKMEGLLRKSIWYALQYPEASRQFIKSHAQEVDDDVIREHILMFVNDFSIDLGREGRRAVEELTGLWKDDVFV